MKRFIISKYLLPITRKPIEKGCLVLDSNKIVALGSYSDLKKEYPSLEQEDLSDYLILPGFVNCHTHLELTPLKDCIDPTDSLTDWITQLLPLKSELSNREIISGVEKGINSLWESGVVAVGDISSEFISYNTLLKSDMIGIVYWEYIAIRPSEVYEHLNRILESMSKALCDKNQFQKGISPHSTYSLCQEAFEMITPYIQDNGFHSAIHVGESFEEKELFENRTGKLFNMINAIYPVSEEINKTHPLTYLYSKGYLNKNSMIIHLNILKDEEVAILKKLDLSVIHCPLSHDYFDHPPFQIKKLLDQGVTVALGTDSLASNVTLNFFEEMRCMKRKFPFLSGKELLNIATISGARAMNLASGMGEIAIGSLYHLIGIKYPEKITDPYEAVIENKLPVIHLKSDRQPKSRIATHQIKRTSAL